MLIKHTGRSKKHHSSEHTVSPCLQRSEKQNHKKNIFDSTVNQVDYQDEYCRTTYQVQGHGGPGATQWWKKKSP
jgi:hypothetical protein